MPRRSRHLPLTLAALLLLTACAGGPGAFPAPTPARTDPAAPTLTTSRPVTGWTVWGNRDQVPSRYRHAVDWHAGSWPVIVVFSYEQVCTFVFNVGAPDVRRGEQLACAWQGPRGTE